MAKKNKKILDVCCGGKMFWWNKNHPSAVYTDNRKGTWKLCDGRTLTISPDFVMDFRNLGFKNRTFNLVIFDPPHLKNCGPNGWLAKKYGRLDKKNWKNDIATGFNECLRVLKQNGVLVFKWSTTDIAANEVLKLFPIDPIVGQKTGKTRWFIFMKD